VRERENWVVVSDIIMGGGECKNNLFSVLTVPRQCPLLLPVRVKHLTGIIFFSFIEILGNP
jgi:hypothetical protein